MLAAEPVFDQFHARSRALGKTYRYFIWNAPSGQPALRRRSWHVPQPLALEVMQAVAGTFVGSHDFAAFQAQGSDVQTTTRRMWTATVAPCQALPDWCAASTDLGRLLCFEVSGEGFLRHMVRVMAGTLVWAGRGRFTPALVELALAGGTRASTGPTAPAHGLHLWHVHYDRDDGRAGT